MAINYLAVLVAAVAAWLFGAVWYGVLGKPWMAALDRPVATNDGKRAMPVGPLITTFLGELLMAFVLAGLMSHLPQSQSPWADGALMGALCWLGFVIPAQTANYAFQMRKLMLSLIDGGHWLAVLVIEGAIIGWFGAR